MATAAKRSSIKADLIGSYTLEVRSSRDRHTDLLNNPKVNPQSKSGRENDFFCSSFRFSAKVLYHNEWKNGDRKQTSVSSPLADPRLIDSWTNSSSLWWSTVVCFSFKISFGILRGWIRGSRSTTLTHKNHVHTFITLVHFWHGIWWSYCTVLSRRQSLRWFKCGHTGFNGEIIVARSNPRCCQDWVYLQGNSRFGYAH